MARTKPETPNWNLTIWFGLVCFLPMMERNDWGGLGLEAEGDTLLQKPKDQNLPTCKSFEAQDTLLTEQ